MTNLQTSMSLNFKDKYSNALKKIVILNSKFSDGLGIAKGKTINFKTGLEKTQTGLFNYGQKLDKVKAQQKALATGIADSVARIATVWSTVKIGGGFLPTTDIGKDAIKTAKSSADIQSATNEKLKEFGNLTKKQNTTLLDLWSNTKEKVKEFKDSLDKLYIGGGIQKFSKIWSEKLLSGVQNVWDAIKSVFNVIKTFITKAIAIIIGGIVIAVSSFIFALDKLHKNWSSVFEKIKEVTNKVIAIIIGGIVVAVSTLIFALDKLFKNWSSVFEKIKEVTNKAIVIIIGGIIVAVSTLIFALDKLFKKWSEVFEKIKEATNAIKKFFGFKNKDEDEEYNTEGTSRFDTTTRFNSGNSPKSNYSNPSNSNYGKPEKFNYSKPEKFNYAKPEKFNYGKPEKFNYGKPEKFNYGKSETFNYGNATALERKKNDIKAELDVHITNEGVPQIKKITNKGKNPLRLGARGSMSLIPN